MPGLEAHGGYAFCGMAALVILGKEHMLDLRALLVSAALSLCITHDASLSLHNSARREYEHESPRGARERTLMAL